MDSLWIVVTVIFIAVIIVLGASIISMKHQQKAREEEIAIQNKKQRSVNNNVKAAQPKRPAQRTSSPPQIKRSSDGTISEAVYLLEKTDSRRKTVDTYGNAKLSDEYYELVFKTKVGDEIVFEVSRKLFRDIPFNEKGMLSYKNGKILKFRYAGGIIEE